MADLTPFPGLRYRAATGEDLTDRLAPPYDVISPSLQRELHERHPHNVIRLELGLDQPGDTPGDDRYHRARTTLDDWVREGVLIVDPPSLYVVEQTFLDQQGQARRRAGLIAAVRLQEFAEGGVRPHELTREAPRADRLNLLRATATNLSPIFALCEEPSVEFEQLLTAVTAGPPLATATGVDTVPNRLWRVPDAPTIAAFQSALAAAPLYIADGHHRYETALEYRAEVRSASATWTGDEPANFTLMTLVSTRSPGLVIFPTHRLLKFNGQLDLTQLQQASEPYFEVAPGDPVAPLEETLPTFVVVTRSGALRLQLRSLASVRPGLSGSPITQQLDVTILHQVLFPQVLPNAGLDLATLTLDYVAESAQAVARVRAGDCEAAVLMQATRMEQVLEVAAAGEKMPSKSTYFSPKLVTGLVMRRLGFEAGGIRGAGYLESNSPMTP